MQVWNSQYVLFIAFGVNSFYMLVSYIAFFCAQRYAIQEYTPSVKISLY
jgi:hypothetical protein